MLGPSRRPTGPRSSPCATSCSPSLPRRWTSWIWTTTTHTMPSEPICSGGWAGTARPPSPTSARPPWRRQTPSETSLGAVAEPRGQQIGDPEQGPARWESSTACGSIEFAFYSRPNPPAVVRDLRGFRPPVGGSGRCGGAWCRRRHAGQRSRWGDPPAEVHWRDLLGGLLHEYRRAA
jgi:hypothetical protein